MQNSFTSCSIWFLRGEVFKDMCVWWKRKFEKQAFRIGKHSILLHNRWTILFYFHTITLLYILKMTFSKLNTKIFKSECVAYSKWFRIKIIQFWNMYILVSENIDRLKYEHITFFIHHIYSWLYKMLVFIYCWCL